MYNGMNVNNKFKQISKGFSLTPELEIDDTPKKFKKHKRKKILIKPKKEIDVQDYIPTQEEIVKENMKFFNPEDVIYTHSSKPSKIEDDKKEDDRDIKKNTRRLKRFYRRTKGEDIYEDEMILTPESVEKDAQNRKILYEMERQQREKNNKNKQENEIEEFEDV